MSTELQQRREFIASYLRPYVRHRHRQPARLTLQFDDVDGLGARLTEFVRLERRCCGFLTFQTHAGGDGVELLISGKSDSEPVLDLFEAAFYERICDEDR